MSISIAIDGPSGAGKSTIARALAIRLGYLYVDTGALYRAVALGCMRTAISLEDAAAVESCLPTLTISLTHASGTQHVWLNGQDVSDDIRTPEVSQWASKLSALPPVRAFLLERQRELARRQNVIMDGRDIGTVVLPDARIKIFLTATPEDRALRRHKELLSRGISCDYDTVLAEVRERDERDINRTIAPTVAAHDAAVIDTTGNTLERSINVLYAHVQSQLDIY